MASREIGDTDLIRITKSRLRTISNKKCILCVITQKKLEKLGYSTLLATTGQEAIDLLQSKFESLNINNSGSSVLEEDKIKSFDISLVLMDCIMPKMSGFDTSRAIRSMNSQISNIPIVALTASEEEETYSKCIESGMNHCLAKPLKTDQFNDIISQYGVNNIMQ
ncbi:13745_t:CDS:2 [Cetraspora pellucida]|uniref:13745_t:CDS:1 n=1 Tax=Cetraspora pellucida TaxID=1433469 RepID=A0A9N9CL54_9GLOM|nr:13745_t:CDS:2 [Cetraspora pellucida]